MLPLIFAIGAIMLIDELVESNENSSRNHRKKIRRNLHHKKLFISFAMEDSRYRDFLVGQGKNKNSSFNFIDMSVKEPWKEDEWKMHCRTKIKNCDGMIVLLSKNTWHSSGSRWEIKCAREEGLPIVGIHIKKADKGAIPPELNGKKVITWSWDNLERVINLI